MKKILILKFDVEGINIRLIRSVVEPHIKGAAKFATIPGFFAISLETTSCIDTVSHDLRLAGWQFMIFDMETSRAEFPGTIGAMFLPFPEAQPFMRETSKSLSSVPNVDRFQWFAQNILDPNKRISVLRNRHVEMQKELSALLADEKFEKAAKVRDYMKEIADIISTLYSNQTVNQ